MISPKKLIRMARKWQKLAAMGRKRISLPQGPIPIAGQNADCCNTSLMVNKGHFVVYTNDQRRFVLPLAYLDNDIFKELFQMAEDEFGLPSNGPITLPCDAVFMEYVVSLIQQHVAKDLEKALLMSITTGRCLSTSYLQKEQTEQQLLICGF
ncbi:hypothetical protein L1049_007894 [Liquidambar formosana]|uniref:Small auxin up regulated protein n=1 Tax=Liquidambar formosana TaxID=63359 RepID=A0AAP0X8S3_LIQFO